MTDEIHDLLTEAAPVPEHAVDLDGVRHAARRRKRRARGGAAVAAAVVIAAAGVATASLSSSDSTPIAVGTATPTISIPDGWTAITVENAGISLAIPPGWARRAPGDAAHEVVAVGSADRPDPGFIGACTAPAPTGTVGTWVSLYEFPAGSTTVSDPVGDTVTVRARPTDFRDELLATGGCGTTPTTSAGSAPRFVNAFATVAFTDAGRVFLARVVTIGTVDQVPELRYGEAVLNTLHVDPLTDATTTTEPATTTTGPAGPTNTTPTTAPAPPAGESADQLAVRTAFLGWLKGKNLDQAEPYVDDFASIRDAEAQGFAQHTPQDIAGFDGRVESVVIADPTHADVVYTLLHDGQPLYANRPGKAVKVDGTWKVTRDTACGLLSMGGIACPA